MIIKLVELELVVKPGCGKDHVKWSPALVYYNNVPTLKQNKPVDKEIISLCPKNCLEIKANKVVLNDIYNCDICKYCEVATEGKIEIVLDENNFILTIEPYGNLSLSNIIKGLDKSFTNDIDELYDQISKLK
jgi:DNA-directed RNA polymerase alpha subunit